MRAVCGILHLIRSAYLQPFRERLKHLEDYRSTFVAAVERQYPLMQETLNELKDLQEILGLREEDVTQIEQEVTSQVIGKSEAHRQKLQRYEQEFTRVIKVEFPLSQYICGGLDKFQSDLGLTEEDVARIKQPIIERRTAEHQQQQLEQQRQRDAENLRQQQEAERLQQQEADRLREQQRRQQKEEADRQQTESHQQQEATRVRRQEREQQRILETRQKQAEAEQQNQARENHQGKKKISNKRLILLGVCGIVIVGISCLFWLNKTEYVSCICQNPAGCKGNLYDPKSGHTVNGETITFGSSPNSLDAYSRLVHHQNLERYRKAGFVCDVVR